MLTVDLDDFMFELKDGSLKHVGASNRTATVKLYDVAETETREFGDERVKLTFEDESGSEVEVALFPEQAEAVADRIETLAAESRVFDEE
jgi:hypothetical protein